jgi:hypothetical protein
VQIIDQVEHGDNEALSKCETLLAAPAKMLCGEWGQSPRIQNGNNNDQNLTRVRPSILTMKQFSENIMSVIMRYRDLNLIIYISSI